MDLISLDSEMHKMNRESLALALVCV